MHTLHGATDPRGAHNPTRSSKNIFTIIVAHLNESNVWRMWWVRNIHPNSTPNIAYCNRKHVSTANLCNRFLACSWPAAISFLIHHQSSLRWSAIYEDPRSINKFAQIEDNRSRVSFEAKRWIRNVVAGMDQFQLCCTAFTFHYNSHCGRSLLICISISNYDTFETLTLFGRCIRRKWQFGPNIGHISIWMLVCRRFAVCQRNVSAKCAAHKYGSI